jgi:hypothetical protein
VMTAILTLRLHPPPSLQRTPDPTASRLSARRR